MRNDGWRPGSARGGERWANSGSALQVEMTGPGDVVHVSGEEEGGIQDGSRFPT